MALVQLVERRCIVAVREAIADGANLEDADDAGKTALHCAVMQLSSSIVDLLIESGAPVDAQNKWGRTPLWYAAKKRREALVKRLIDAGADIHLLDDTGRSPLELVAGWCSLDLLQWLAAAGVDLNMRWGADQSSDLLRSACYRYQWDIAHYLLDRGFELRDDPDYQWSLMSRSICGSNPQLLQQLLEEHGYDPMIVGQTYSYHGKTLLHLASEVDNIAAAKALIQAGANAHAKSPDGHTPAAVGRSKEMRRFFATLTTVKSALH